MVIICMYKCSNNIFDMILIIEFSMADSFVTSQFWTLTFSFKFVELCFLTHLGYWKLHENGLMFFLKLEE